MSVLRNGQQPQCSLRHEYQVTNCVHCNEHARVDLLRSRFINFYNQCLVEKLDCWEHKTGTQINIRPHNVNCWKYMLTVKKNFSVTVILFILK